MSITKKDVKNIASLAQLNIGGDELEHFVLEMTEILALIRQMQAIDTTDIEPMPHPQDIQLRLREDQVTEPNQRDQLQKIAPATANGLYLVPKVLD